MYNKNIYKEQGIAIYMIVQFRGDLIFYCNIPEVIDKIRFVYVKIAYDAIEM
ncbi:hypothetical protein [Candidatus Nitrosocosmicus sp. R]